MSRLEAMKKLGEREKACTKKGELTQRRSRSPIGQEELGMSGATYREGKSLDTKGDQEEEREQGSTGKGKGDPIYAHPGKMGGWKQATGEEKHGIEQAKIRT